jgi:pterin-4a-carbinolamine dehydratase
MSSLVTIMQDYFDESPAPPNTGNSFLIKEQKRVPITPEVITWKIVTDPERLMRRFEFKSRQRLIDFLGEVLEMENEMNHNAKITIDHLYIDIEVYTKSIDCVTEIDLEYTQTVSQIYEDVSHYGYESK